MTSHSETAGDWGYPEPGGEVYTEGHSGSDTSRDRALTDAREGRDVKRRAKALALLREAGDYGLTWWEMDDLTGWGHGKVSGALSNLHKEGRIARLVETRGRSKVYILPDLVGDRPTEVRRSNKAVDSDSVEQAAYQRGFDDGESVASDELTAALNRAMIDGYGQGERATRARIANHLLSLGRAVKATSPSGMHVHTKECFLTRPACLMDAVMKAVSTEVRVKDRSA